MGPEGIVGSPPVCQKGNGCGDEVGDLRDMQPEGSITTGKQLPPLKIQVLSHGFDIPSIYLLF